MDLSNSAINKIGDIIRKGPEAEGYAFAIDTLNIWRELHGDILDEYYGKCFRLASRYSREIIVARRLKRLPTIVDKLDRQPKMRLSAMQDIAGVRIVARNMTEFRLLKKRLSRWKYLKSIKDYISEPKSDGYRGMHFIFKKNNQYVEIQLRTQLQHVWSTAVESTDVFRGSSMKTRGDNTYWGGFFLVASASFANIEETAPVAGFEDEGLMSMIAKLGSYAKQHKIIDKIGSMAFTEEISTDRRFRKSDYVLMDLDFIMKKCSVICFNAKQYDDAIREYEKLEADTKRRHSSVLVSVNSFNKLKDAYPNYFVDLRKFAGLITFMIDYS